MFVFVERWWRMEQRMDYTKAFPQGTNALLHVGNVIKTAGLDPALMELVKIRASQMNGCAYCIDMHTKDARAMGETEQRIYALAAWRETPFFTEIERAALSWTEALTNIQDGHVPDEIYQNVSGHFDEASLMKLTLTVTQINTWNRIAIAFRAEPGSYQPVKA